MIPRLSHVVLQVAPMSPRDRLTMPAAQQQLLSMQSDEQQGRAGMPAKDPLSPRPPPPPRPLRPAAAAAFRVLVKELLHPPSAAESGGGSDGGFFVVLSAGGRRLESRPVISAGGELVWGEELVFPPAAAGSPVSCSVLEDTVCI